MTRPQVASRSEVARGLRASVCAATPRRGSLLYKVKTMLALSAAAVSSALSAAVPAIRYTAEAPFDAEGKRIESVWKNADTCVRFVEIVLSSTAASLPSPCHTYSANGILSESRHSLIFVRGGRVWDEGLARTRGGYLRRAMRNRGKDEVRPAAWPLGFLTEIVRLIAEYNKSEVQSPLRMPDLLMVITGGEYAYTRVDGVIVCPISALRP